uniref:Uncharacterized protein n=1 Tax=Wolbachia endosymbiont of Aleurodicus dispersus TaxID=1288877 RepID=A0A3B0IWQ3_9RICK
MNQLNAVIKHHPDVGKGDSFFIIIDRNNIMGATAYTNVKNPSYGLTKAIKLRNRGLFRLHGIGN